MSFDTVKYIFNILSLFSSYFCEKLLAIRAMYKDGGSYTYGNTVFWDVYNISFPLNFFFFNHVFCDRELVGNT